MDGACGIWRSRASPALLLHRSECGLTLVELRLLDLLSMEHTFSCELSLEVLLYLAMRRSLWRSCSLEVSSSSASGCLGNTSVGLTWNLKGGRSMLRAGSILPCPQPRPTKSRCVDRVCA